MINPNNAYDIFLSAVESVKPQTLIDHNCRFDKGILNIKDHSFKLKEYNKIYIIGAGKASADMALAMEKKLGKLISTGLVITKYGHLKPCKRIKIAEAAHPVPDENSLNYSKQILEIADLAKEDDLVICLISGGGSALLEVLPENISLKEIQELNNVLLASGAEINEINTIRKAISLIKGGKLAKRIFPATCVSLIISDILGDPLVNIASGPTVLNKTRNNNNLKEIFDKYALREKLPLNILNYLKDPVQLKNEVYQGENNFNIIIGNNQTALDAACKKAQAMGYTPKIISNHLHGEARLAAIEIAKSIADYSQKEKPVCLLWGGETTVTLKGSGKGGRNTEMALAVLIELKNISEPFVLLSAGTDGTDGPTDAAGAIISNESWPQIKAKNIDPPAFLENNDSYTFFEKTGGLLKTGPTGTNVMDIVIALIG